MPSRSRFGLSHGLALLLALVPGSASAQAAPATPAANSEPPTNKSSSWWLKAGEYRQEKGQHASAGVAYAQALDALPDKRKRANVGARAAMLSADAYWLAFEQNEDIAHLQAAIEVLERWIELTGAGSRATLLPQVERSAARLRAIQQPLEALDAALGRGELEAAAKHHATLAEAMVIQDRPWPLGARITLRVARAHVESYDQGAVEVEQIEPNRPKLERAKAALERWIGERPEDDDSPEGPAIVQLIADIQARLDAGDQRVNDALLAEQQRSAAEAAAREQQRQQEEQRAQQEAARAAQEDGSEKKRRVSIALLSAGAVATAAGAGLLGEGLAHRSSFQGPLDDERAEADMLEQMFADGYDQDGFERAASEYSDQVRRRNLALISSGAVLAGAGLAMGITGAVLLVKNRRAKPGAAEQARLLPSLSRSHAGLSLAARF